MHIQPWGASAADIRRPAGLGDVNGVSRASGAVTMSTRAHLHTGAADRATPMQALLQRFHACPCMAAGASCSLCVKCSLSLHCIDCLPDFAVCAWLQVSFALGVVQKGVSGGLMTGALFNMCTCRNTWELLLPAKHLVHCKCMSAFMQFQTRPSSFPCPRAFL